MLGNAGYDNVFHAGFWALSSAELSILIATGLDWRRI